MTCCESSFFEPDSSLSFLISSDWSLVTLNSQYLSFQPFQAASKSIQGLPTNEVHWPAAVSRPAYMVTVQGFRPSGKLIPRSAACDWKICSLAFLLGSYWSNSTDSFVFWLGFASLFVLAIRAAENLNYLCSSINSSFLRSYFYGRFSSQQNVNLRA